jgi:hypothetical protein
MYEPGNHTTTKGYQLLAEWQVDLRSHGRHNTVICANAALSRIDQKTRLACEG